MCAEVAVASVSIRLTLEGDALVLPTEFSCEQSAPTAIYASMRCGIHEVCGGEMMTHLGSKTHFAIVCGRCFLRVPVHVGIRTFFDLREECAKKIMPGSILPGS